MRRLVTVTTATIVAAGALWASAAAAQPGARPAANEVYQGYVNDRSGTVDVVAPGCADGSTYSDPVSLQVRVDHLPEGTAGTDESGWTPQPGYTGNRMPTNIEVEVLGSPSGSNRTVLQRYGELATITTVLDCTPTNGVQRVVFRAVNGGANRIKSSVLIRRLETPPNRAPEVHITGNRVTVECPTEPFRFDDIDLAVMFTDPDGDPLTIEHSHDALPAGWSSEVVDEGGVRTWQMAIGTEPGTVVVTFTATDPGGLSATSSNTFSCHTP